MLNNQEFTAYALGEHENPEKFHAQLLEQGITEEQITTRKNEINKVGESVKEEFKKDESLRLAVEQREELYPKKPFPWLKTLSYAGGLGVVSIVGVSLIEPEVSRYQQKSPRVDKVLDQTMSENEAVFDDSTAFMPSSPKKMKPKGAVGTVSKRRSGPSDSYFGSGGAGGAASQSIDMEDGGPGNAPIFPTRTMPMSDMVKAEKMNREAYDKIDVNPYLSAIENPLSTFSVDVDTAAYANMRRFLFRGQLPPKDSIRVEELVNYFSYDYRMNFDQHPVDVQVDYSQSPWNKDRQLVRVALASDPSSDLVNAGKNLVFLLDVSGSMDDAKKLPLLKDSMRILIRKLKPEDTISIVVYAGASGVVLEPTAAKEKNKIYQALDNLSAGGSTNGGAGIQAAYKMAKQAFKKDGVNRIILATDGDFNVGTTSQSSLIELVEEKAKDDIYLTVVGLGMGNYQDSILEKISNRGNGNYAYIDSLIEANKLFNVDIEKNLTTVAKDVKIQVEFNPAKVKAYKLIGYENRKLAAQDFNDDKKDAGEMGAGHNVTALYEIFPVGGDIDLPKVDKLKYANKVKANNDSNEVLTVKLRYKQPNSDISTKFEKALKGKAKAFKEADQEMRFAATVASFGMKLRGDELAQNLSYRDLKKMAEDSKGDDRHDFREEFIELIEQAKQIDN